MLLSKIIIGNLLFLNLTGANFRIFLRDFYGLVVLETSNLTPNLSQ